MRNLVVPYDQRWPARYAEEAERLRAVLGGVVLGVEHVGSTAVPRIAAKPTIDIAVAVRKLAEVGDDHVAAMTGLGYVYRGEAGVAGRHYFRKGVSYPREFHVSVVEHDGVLWRDYLLLRDYLRTHEDEARAYANAKRDAERASGGHDPLAYWDHKHPFIEAMLERARAPEADTSRDSP